MRPAFVDVRRPSVADALGALPSPAGRPIVVPAFLAAGYHVHADLPAQLAEAASGAASGVEAQITPLLGPDPLVVAAAADRLYRAGWRPGDAVVLGAAGSRDPRARVDLETAAALLGRRLGVEVHPGYLASGSPRAVELIGSLRDSGRRVAAASWLLAPGLFHQRLADSGAEVVSEPLGVHAGVVRALVGRYRAAVAGRVDSPVSAAS